jgi:hypothetical protein
MEKTGYLFVDVIKKTSFAATITKRIALFVVETTAGN